MPQFRAFFDRLKAHRWAILAFAVPVLIGLAIRVHLALQPIDLVVERLFIDDTFFYLRVGQEITLGHGSTFDGIHLTNGYHPLWVGVLVPLFKLFSDPQGSYVRAVLFAQIAFNLVSLYFVWRCIRFFTDRRWVEWIGVTAYFLNPCVIFMTLNGMETPLFMMLLSIFLFLFFSWAFHDRHSRGWFFLLGVTAGLLVLARSDAIILIGLAFVCVWWRERRRASFWSYALPLALPGVLFALPLLAWSYVKLGTFVQVNALASAMGRRVMFGSPVPPYGLHDLLWMAKQGGWILSHDLVNFSTLVAIRVPLLFLLGVAAILFGMRTSADTEGWFGRRLGWLMVPVLSYGCLFFLLSFVRWYNRDYYMAPWNLFAVLFVVIVLTGIYRMRIPNAGTIVAVAAFAIAVSCFWTYREAYRPGLRHNMNTNVAAKRAAEWIDANLPEDALVGSYGYAGALSFYSRHTIVNLDGKINNSVYPYLRDRQLETYLRSEGIRYISEDEARFQRRNPFYSPGFSLERGFVHVGHITDPSDASAPAMDVYEFTAYEPR